MPTAQLRRYPVILRDLMARVVTRSALTDITDASRFKRFLAAIAREVDEVHYQLVRVRDVWSLDRATGEDLDRRVADLQPLGLVRLGPRRAAGSVVFSRRLATPDVRIIPAGTVALTPSGLAFWTTREVEITPVSPPQIAGHGIGRDSIPAPAVALAPGEAGNVVAGAITRLQGTVVGVDEAANTVPFVLGRTGETDDQLRARAKGYLASLARCGSRAIELAAIGVSDGAREVVYARALPNPLRRGDVTLYIDDGTGASEATARVVDELVTAGLLGPPADRAVGGEELLALDLPPVRLESFYEVRVNGVPRTNDLDVFLSPTDGTLRFAPALAPGDLVQADYTRYVGLIALVQRVINGVPGDPALPGWGAAGVRVRVRAPRVVSPDFAGTLYLREGTDRPRAVLAAQNATLTLLNQLGISEDAVLAQVVDAVMEVPGVADFVIDTPTSNVVVLDDELVRVTAANLDYD